MTRKLILRVSVVFATLLCGLSPAKSFHLHLHNSSHGALSSKESASLETLSKPTRLMMKTGVSGQGTMSFRVLYTRAHLPERAEAVVEKAHGGFAVDRREGHGEVYFALAGAGIIKISDDLETTYLLDTPEEIRDINLHNTSIWFEGSEAFLTFPANDAGKIYTTSLDGRLQHTLGISSGVDFGARQVNQYFAENGKFAPTDVDQLGDFLYATTGYSDLDYVLTIRIRGTRPLALEWYPLAFGGKGTGAGQFGTGHGITARPDRQQLEIADRPHAEIDSYSAQGRYLSTLNLPAGSFPCDVDHAGRYTLVACLHGPDRNRGAPLYVLEGSTVVSTIMPKEELGLENFQHLHNAVFRVLDGRFYIIVQSWNPGGFAILQQVTD